jgi:predicted acyl esterase
MALGPHAVTVVKNVLIPMRDGVELAADLHLPAGEGPWPAVMTYFPYHKDGTGGLRSVDPIHRNFASHGFACLTLDVRGTGSSGGTTVTPYADDEPSDGYDAIEWIAAQPWCRGAVGLWGASYGGATTLSVAATNPPHLRAIVPIHGSADEYDGFLRPHGWRPGFWTEADWGPMMVAMNLLPPLYRDDAGRWSRVWQEHLSGGAPWPLAWHGGRPDWTPVQVDVEAITAPMFAICGWLDYYPGVTLHFFNRARVPKRALIGPWKHTMPDDSPVAPIGGLAEMRRWWERWLNEVDNGVDREPPVAIYVQGANTWRYEEAWPPPSMREETWYIGAERALAVEPPGGDVRETHVVDATAGTSSMLWDPLTPHIPYPADHRPDDARALAFTTAPLAADLEICGEPSVRIRVSADQPGLLSAKLCAVAADGHSTLICRGWEPHETPASESSAPAPRSAERTIVLDATSFRVPAGHRLRLTIAGADFPLLWPAPAPVALTVHSSSVGTSWLTLPVRPATGDERQPTWGPAEPAARAGVSSGQWDVSYDIVQRTTTVNHRSRTILPLDGSATLLFEKEQQSSVDPARPRYSRMAARVVAELEDDRLPVVVDTHTTQTTHLLAISARVTLHGQVIYERSWRLPLDDRGEGCGPVDSAASSAMQGGG